MYKYIKQPLSCKLQKLKTKHNWNKNPESLPKAVKPEMEISEMPNTFDGSQKGKVLSTVFELRDEISVFFPKEECNDLAHRFYCREFLMKLVRISDLFLELEKLQLLITNAHLSLRRCDGYMCHI